MSAAAILTMIALGGFVWGGFVLLLTRALRTERVKQREREAGR